MPSPPLLVPELAGGAAAETAGLRQAAVAVAAELGAVSDRWLLVGVSPAPVAARAGTFRGFGWDGVVGLDPVPAADDPDPDMPLAALVAGWLRGQAAPHATVEPLLVPQNTPPAECARIGAGLRPQRGRLAVLVVADGANTLTEAAPGAFHPDAPALQERVDAALAGGDTAALAALDAAAAAAVGMTGRAAWQVLAGLFGAPPPQAAGRYVGAPYGVGYHVGTWWR